ncbi:hypothetical protein LP418_17670 [Nocardioides sp. B-3]|nr:hypothetical protein LP418_17670 [Nocardioides sp. B-3]
MPSGRRLHAKTGRSSAPLRPPGQRLGTAHHRVRVDVVGDRQSDGPARRHEDRSEPVRRQVEAQTHPALEVALLDQQPGGLGHPVGVGRQRQLDPLVGLVVVEGDERAAGIAAQLPGQHG